MVDISALSRGDESTLLERFAHSLRLPYALGCLLLATVAGPPFLFVALLVITQNVNFALSNVLNVPFENPGATVTTQIGLVIQGTWYASLFAAAYVTRFMRVRLVDVQSELSALALEPDETFHKAFGKVTKPIPVVVLSLVFFALTAPYVFQSPLVGQFPLFIIWELFGSWLAVLIFAAFLWVYISSLWGLYKFGKSKLKLKDYHEDQHLGVRPIGSMSISLFYAFSIVAVVLGVGIILSSDPLTIVYILGFFLIGGVMFFLPLTSIHRQMAKEKRNQQRIIGARFAELADSKRGSAPDTSSDKLDRLSDILLLQVTRSDVAAIPTWPYDLGILERFSAIILSVTAVIIARYLQIALNIAH